MNIQMVGMVLGGVLWAGAGGAAPHEFLQRSVAEICKAGSPVGS